MGPQNQVPEAGILVNLTKRRVKEARDKGFKKQKEHVRRGGDWEEEIQ